ncbi:MAG: site-2 protease family protein [Candidatus Hydrogenedentota bacterium]
MFSHRLTILKLFGFAVKIDISWVFLAALITWSLAEGFFPQQYSGLTTTTYWLMGALGALGLFVSIILHELGHSLVARRFGLPIRDITLFIFGGVADMEEEPPTAPAEFWMAIAGPVVSVTIAAVCGLVYYVVVYIGGAPSIGMTVVGYLGLVNAVLALFNLMPAFPLDGGRVFRALLWGWKRDLRWATRVASGIGRGFGLVLIGLGILSILGGNVIGGIWFCLIGMFMRMASHAAYKQLLVRRVLEGEPVARFMKRTPITVPPETTVADLVEHYIYKYHYKMFPVVTEEGDFRGVVTTREVKEVEREDWPTTTVGAIMKAASPENSIGPDEDATKALNALNKSGASRLLVVQNGELCGIVALKDLMGFLQLKLDLDPNSGGPPAGADTGLHGLPR